MASPLTSAVPHPAEREARDSGGPEIFWYLGLYEFDVDAANQFVRDGREPVELEEESARTSVEESELNEDHLPNVDPSVPGIIAHIWYQTEEGERLHGHVLIDGHHRAARCLREQRPVLVYLLTEEESRTVLLREPGQLPRLRKGVLRADKPHTAKNPHTGASYELTEEEHYLLDLLAERRTPDELRARFEARFGKLLVEGELNVFLRRAQSRGFFRFASGKKRRS